MRKNISSGSTWEDKVAYSRAVRIGNTIEVAGTVAMDSENNLIGKDDPYEQSLFILNKIIEFVEELRNFVRPISGYKYIKTPFCIDGNAD